MAYIYTKTCFITLTTCRNVMLYMYILMELINFFFLNYVLIVFIDSQVKKTYKSTYHDTNIVNINYFCWHKNYQKQYFHFIVLKKYFWTWCSDNKNNNNKGFITNINLKKS